MTTDASIYAFHAGYWLSYSVRALPAAAGVAGAPVAGEAGEAGEAKVARWSRTLVFLHMSGFFGTYFGIGDGVFGPFGAPDLFPFQRVVGATIIVLAAALVVWALAYFRSWRIRAAVEPGHALATGGPFAWVRNPIYLSMALLSLGSLVWLPSGIGAGGLALVCVFGDLRARAEEGLLEASFGEPYRAYRARVKRFIPGVY